MKGKRFVDDSISKDIAELVRRTEHRTLAAWAADCAERVLPFFESERPCDPRPREAIEACREWASTGILNIKEVREIALSAHAAARETAEESAARFAARSAGHAMATAHVPTHAVAAASYAAKATWADNHLEAERNVAKERHWQHRRLVELNGPESKRHHALTAAECSPRRWRARTR
jgi:hypothetical protein